MTTIPFRAYRTRSSESFHKDLIIEALTLYCQKNIDYIDAYNALVLKEKGVEEVFSYDKHYDRIDWLTRSEP